jgi:hypothetical protein
MSKILTTYSVGRCTRCTGDDVNCAGSTVTDDDVIDAADAADAEDCADDANVSDDGGDDEESIVDAAAFPTDIGDVVVCISVAR